MHTRRLSSLFTRTIATSLVSLGLATGLAHGDDPASNPTIWVANGRDATVSVIDRVDGDTLARLPSGGNPHVLELSPDGSTMYVVNAGGHDLPDDEGAAHAGRPDAAPLATNSLWALDTSSGDVVGRVAVGMGPTHPVPSPDGTRVYVTNTDDDSISIVDTGSWTVIETVTGVREPHDAAITADGTRLLIAAAGSNEVLVIDTETRAIVDRFAVGNKVRGLILDHDDAVAYATNKADGTVSRIDLASGDVQTFAVGAGPHGLRLAPDGSRLYVALSGANAVAYVDPASGDVERTVPVGASPEQLDISPDGAWLAVANAADETVTLVDVERAAPLRSSATGLRSRQPMPTPDRNPISQARVTQIYDRNAPFYDAMETPMEWLALRAWRRNLISGLSGQVLELGVGTGRNLALYPADVALTAVDVAPSMLKRARARARQLGIDATFVQADMRDLPFETASFDAVVTSCVFCSVAEPRAGLAEARRVLKPGGYLRMLEHQRPDPPALGWLFDRLNPLAVRLTGANLNRETQRLVEDAGFSSVTARRLDGLGIVRFFNACDAREPEVGTEEADATADASDATGAPPAGTPRDNRR